jgi:hypothetical protein
MTGAGSGRKGLLARCRRGPVEVVIASSIARASPLALRIAGCRRAPRWPQA